MLTAKGKYGLKAMVHLAHMDEGDLALITDIATQNAIPKKFLDAILLQLRNAGFVQSRKGKGGGYRLIKRPEDIRIGDLVRSLDGPLAPIPCASYTRYEACDDCDVDTCEVRHMMLNVRNAIAKVMDSTTLAQMRDAEGEVLPIELLAAAAPAKRKRNRVS